MNIHIKRLALTGASLLVALGVGAGLKSSHANASMIYEDQYPSHFNRLIPGGRASHNFYKYGYLFHAKRVMGSPGAITGIDNDYHVSKGQVERALEGKRIFKPRVRKVHHHAKRDWKLIDTEFYRIDNDEVVPKSISGYWQLNNSKNNAFYLSHEHVGHISRSDVNELNNRQYYETKQIATFLKNHHLGNKSLVKHVGHNRYVLNFASDNYLGPFYTKGEGHPIIEIHLINHHKMYVKNYEHGKLDKNDSGYAHRISRSHYNKISD